MSGLYSTTSPVAVVGDRNASDVLCRRNNRARRRFLGLGRFAWRRQVEEDWLLRGDPFLKESKRRVDIHAAGGHDEVDGGIALVGVTEVAIHSGEIARFCAALRKRSPRRAWPPVS